MDNGAGILKNLRMEPTDTSPGATRRRMYGRRLHGKPQSLDSNPHEGEVSTAPTAVNAGPLVPCGLCHELPKRREVVCNLIVAMFYTGHVSIRTGHQVHLEVNHNTKEVYPLRKKSQVRPYEDKGIGAHTARETNIDTT